MGHVISVGAITVDVTSFSERLPRPGETLLGTNFTLVPGGKGANQAVAAARAGAATRMVGCIGEDFFGELALANLQDEGIDIDSVTTVPGMTGVAHIRVDASAENDIVVIPLANASLTPQLVLEGLGAVSSSDVVMTQLEVARESTFAAIDLAKSMGARVILDPAPAIAGLPDEVWAGLFAVTPNENEAEIITGIRVHDSSSAEQAGRWFLDRGVELAVVTLASHGAVAVSSGGAVWIEAFPVEAIDTTAAGDAFTGYLAAGLASGLNLDETLRRAMAAGALAVTAVGASSSLPRCDVVDEFLATR